MKRLCLAPRVGFEPTALGLEVLCSIQLSYRGICALIISRYCCLSRSFPLSLIKTSLEPQRRNFISDETTLTTCILWLTFLLLCVIILQ